jgi:hypothetical protein
LGKPGNLYFEELESSTNYNFLSLPHLWRGVIAHSLSLLVWRMYDSAVMNKETVEENDEIEVLLQRALDALKTLSKTVLDGRKPPGGAYAFFSHNAHAGSTTQDCGRILGRMRAGRIRLTELANMEDRLSLVDSPPQTPIPENMQAIMHEEHDATELMKLDFESLYMFGGILLDQWSLLAIAIGNISCKKVHPFPELVNFLESNEGHPLASVWTKTKSDMSWLYYQIRFIATDSLYMLTGRGSVVQQGQHMAVTSIYLYQLHLDGSMMTH